MGAVRHSSASRAVEAEASWPSRRPGLRSWVAAVRRSAAPAPRAAETLTKFQLGRCSDGPGLERGIDAEAERLHELLRPHEIAGGAGAAVAAPADREDRLRARVAELIAARYPDRTVYVVGDAAYAGEHLRNLGDQITWTSRLKITSVLHELPPPRTGRSGRPRVDSALKLTL